MEQATFFKAQKLFKVLEDLDLQIAEFKAFLQYSGSTVQLSLDGGGYKARCVFNKDQLAPFLNGLVADLERAADKARADLAAL